MQSAHDETSTLPIVSCATLLTFFTMQTNGAQPHPYYVLLSAGGKQ